MNTVLKTLISVVYVAHSFTGDKGSPHSFADGKVMEKKRWNEIFIHFFFYSWMDTSVTDDNVLPFFSLSPFIRCKKVQIHPKFIKP